MPSVPNPLFSAPLPTDSAIDSLYPPTQSLNPWQLIRALTPTNPLYLRHSTHYSQPRIASSSPVKDDGTIWLREPHLLVSDKNAAGKQTISYLSSNWCQPTTVEAGDILTVKWAASSTEWEAIQIQISARVFHPDLKHTEVPLDHSVKYWLWVGHCPCVWQCICFHRFRYQIANVNLAEVSMVLN